MSSTKSLPRLLATVSVTAAVFTGTAIGAPAVHAISPAQTNEAGVVYQLGGRQPGAIDGFWSMAFESWGLRYITPRILFFNTNTIGHYYTACGNTWSSRNNGLYCRGDSSIYFDYQEMDRRIQHLGDYSAGGLLAHEFGHHVQSLLGFAMDSHKAEYHADCLAGMYTRWGYANGRLTGGDYWEYHNWLLSTPWSETHGSPQLRTEWYRYGWSTYDLRSCNLAYR